MTTPELPIVILGGGFAGRATAQHLAALLDAESPPIILIDQNDFSLFTPMLTEVAGGEVDGSDIVASLRELPSRIRFLQGRVEDIDVDHKRVVVCLGAAGEHIPEERRTIEAGHLVIALGSVTNFHHIPGLAQHSLSIKTVEEARAIRNRAIALLQRASEERDAGQRRTLSTFVIGGGGFSGVETAAALNGMLREISSTFDRIQAHDIRVMLVQPGDRILPEISPGLAQYAHTKLSERGVNIMLRTSITGAGEGWVEVQDHDGKQHRIETSTVVWAGGVTPSPAVQSSSAKLGRHHGIETDGCCAVPGHPGVWAIGDCAEIPKPGGKSTYAPTAQNAIREGPVVAQNVVASMRGGSAATFDYHPAGEMAIVGRRAGVANLYGFQLAGFLVWVMWRVIYLAKLPTVEKRIRVAVDWMLDVVFGRELSTLPGSDLRDLEAETSLSSTG